MTKTSMSLLLRSNFFILIFLFKFFCFDKLQLFSSSLLLEGTSLCLKEIVWKEQHLKMLPLPNGKILFQANIMENLIVHSDFSRVPKIETFSLNVKQNSPPRFCLYCVKAWSWLYCTVQKKKYMDVFPSWMSLCFKKLHVIILTDTVILCSWWWWENHKFGYKQQKSLNWNGRHCHVLKPAGICIWSCHLSKLKTKLRNGWSEWESAVLYL